MPRGARSLRLAAALCVALGRGGSAARAARTPLSKYERGAKPGQAPSIELNGPSVSNKHLTCTTTLLRTLYNTVRGSDPPPLPLFLSLSVYSLFSLLSSLSLLSPLFSERTDL